MKGISNTIYLFLLIWPLSFGESLNAQCDTSLEPEQNSRGYQKRTTNHCEGFYESKVAAGSLNIVGVTQGKFRFEFDTNELLTISSPIVKDTINVRAVGIPLQTYYRMDATILPNGSLKWPVGDVLYPYQLKYKKIGVFGWLVSKKNKTYIPLKVISAVRPAPEDSTIYIYLRASIDVMNVRWRFADVSEDGTCDKADKWIKPKKKSYKSGNRIVCKVPADRRGKICLEVKAESQEGDEKLRLDAKIILN